MITAIRCHMTKVLLFGVLSLCFFNASRAQKFNLTSDQLEVGDRLVLKIWFDLSKYDVRPECYPLLDSVVNFMKSKPNVVIEVGVHTNKIDPRLSLRFDSKRAQAIMGYLISKGIQAERLSSKGYGHSEPIISEDKIAAMKDENEKLEAQATNRRCELKIITL